MVCCDCLNLIFFDFRLPSFRFDSAILKLLLINYSSRVLTGLFARELTIYYFIIYLSYLLSDTQFYNNLLCFQKNYLCETETSEQKFRKNSVLKS